MAEITWKSILTKLVGGDHLSAEESEWFVDDLMNGNANPAAVGAVLATQQQLGLTPDEVRGAAKAMVSHAIKLDIDGETTGYRRYRWRRRRDGESVFHGRGGGCRSRSESREARQSCSLFQVRHCRLLRGAGTAARSGTGTGC